MSPRSKDERPRKGIGRLFDELRTAQAAPAPTFRTLWTRAGRRPQSPRWRLRPAVATLTVAALAAGFALWTWRAGRPPERIEPEEAQRLAAALTTWEAPLDFLLEVPGAELLRSTPTFRRPALALPTTEPDPPTETEN